MKKGIMSAEPHQEFIGGKWTWYLEYAYIEGDQVKTQWVSANNKEGVIANMAKAIEDYNARKEE
jgi:hypothetical protein